MRKLLFTLLGVLPSFLIFAQTDAPKAPEMPIDPVTKLISYTDVSQVDGVPGKELYARALKWFNAYYVNPTDVIRENEPEKNRIMGKHRFKIYNEADKKGVVTEAGYVEYSVIVAARDGRYKAELTNINWKLISYTPIEKWMDKSAPTYLPVYEYYLKQTDEFARKLIADLNKVLTAKPVKDTRDDW